MTPDQQELWGRKVAAIPMAEREGRLLVVEPELARAVQAEIDRLRTELAVAQNELSSAKRWAAGTAAEPSRPAAPVLRWTDRKPTEPDWYWVRGGWAGDGVVVYVEFYPGLLDPVILAFGASDRKVPARAEWAGPVPRPIPRSQRDVDDPS